MRPVHLDRNENHYGPAPACLEALRSVEPALLHDYTRDFKRGYYSELSRRLAEIHGVDEKQIVLGYGCEDILKQAVHHGLRAGERCFVPSASWWYYGAIASEVDGVTIRYPLVETEQSYRYDLDRLFDLHARSPARVLLLATPNNPTGNVIEPPLLPAILERFRDAMVLLDEAYWGFGENGADSARLTEQYPNLLVLRTFSKLFGLAGARIGYGVAGRGLEGFLRFSARYLGYCRVSERLALAALASPEYYAAVRAKMASDCRLLVELLRSFDGIRAYDSVANFLLVRFPEHVAGPLRRGLEARGLYAKFLDEPEFRHCARISLGTEAENARLRAAFEELLPAMVGSKPAHAAT